MRKASLRRRRAGFAAAAIAVTAVAVVLLGSAAGAHSFLVSTTPAQGERLGDSPEVAVLEFSETIDPASVSVRVTTFAGAVIADLPIEVVEGALAVRGIMPALDAGVFLVSWEALSAVDGHGSAGEFAFAVGSVDGSIPAASASEPTDVAAMVAGWLFVAGVAAATGAMIISLIASPHMAFAIKAGRLGLIVAGSGALVAAVGGRSGGLTALWVLQALLLGLIVIGFARPWWTLVATGSQSRCGRLAATEPKTDGLAGCSTSCIWRPASPGSALSLSSSSSLQGSDANTDHGRRSSLLTPSQRSSCSHSAQQRWLGAKG